MANLWEFDLLIYIPPMWHNLSPKSVFLFLFSIQCITRKRGIISQISHNISRDFLDAKSKSPLFPGGWGAVVTNDWYVMVNVQRIYSQNHVFVENMLQLK